MRVAVIGAGLIGLWSAVELSRAGAKVTVIDAGPQPGFSSPAAAGWVVPALSAPLAGPGIVGHSARQVLRGEAPFSVTPRLTPSLVSWLVRFVRSSRGYEDGLRAVLQLGAGCAEDFAALGRAGVDLELRRVGLLMAARTAEGLEEVRALGRSAAAAGYGGEFAVLSGAEARSQEPALGAGVVGAVYARDELQVRPEQVLAALRRQLLELGGRLVEAEVGALTPTATGWRIQTRPTSPTHEPSARRGTAAGAGRGGDPGREARTGGVVEADRVVVAAGVWSAEVLAPLGVRLPVVSATGYSITATGSGLAPRGALKLVEPSIAVTPFSDGVRIAARLDLGQLGSTIPRRRWQQVLRQTAAYLGDWRPGEVSVSYVGRRPATPDSLPLIGPVPGRPGLYVATGHGMLGLTLAPGTARSVVPLVLEDNPPPVLHPFTLDRRRPARA